MKNERMIELRGNETQKKVAVDLNIPVSTYAMIETGHRFPRRDLQARLAAYFKVTVGYLFFGENSHVTRSKRSNTA